MIDQKKENMNNICNTKSYVAEINRIRQELSKLPDGHLTKRGQYYCQTIGKTQKGITKYPHRVRQLAYKAYLLKRLKHLEWNYSILERLSKRAKTESFMDIIKELPSFYHTIPVDHFFHPSVREQLDNTVEGKTGYIDDLIFTTYSGIRVRSKSERTIADALDQNMIPYRYEAATRFGREIRYPDFTIFRPSEGKKILWEHFGLIDDEEYRQTTIEKLALYSRHGYFPFDNLICTYEQDLRDVDYIYKIIELFLLKCYRL